MKSLETERKPLSPLQNGAVYGPIHSRRLGDSLGINLLPVSYKFCDFDCVYCQYGWTPEKGSGEKLKRAGELLSEIKASLEFYKNKGTRVDCLTLAGNGEPTIHPDFPEIVSGLCSLRDLIYPEVRIGILTDSSQAYRPEIKQALGKLDERYMKLDAGTEALLLKINKPRGHFSFTRLVESLKTLDDIVIQSLFMQGSYDNTLPEHIDAWVRVIADIRPKEVQVYSIDRGPADAGLRKVAKSELARIARICEKETGVKSVVFD